MLVPGPARSGKGRSWSCCPPEQDQIPWPCWERGGQILGSGSTGTMCAACVHLPRGDGARAGQSRAPWARVDSPHLQAVGAGQGGGGEEDFSSKLNLLENLACSPSS